MPTGQQYATNVPQTTLTGLINPTATLMSVASSSGWPATPFTAILDISLSTQEPVDVTNITGTTWTIVRAIDGTVGFTHQVGATVTHGDIGRDFRDARTHIDTATGQHGIAGGSSVVGTTDVQNLSNKTIAAATFTGNQAMGSGTWSGTGNVAESFFRFSGVTGANSQVGGIMGSFNYAATSAGPNAGTFNTGDMVVDTTYNILWICTAGGTPGTWAPLTGEVKIFSSTLVAPTARFNFSVPTWAKSIRAEYSVRSDQAGTAAAFSARFNGDTGNNYLWQDDQSNNATDTPATSGGLVSSINIGACVGGTATANYFGAGNFWVPNITSSTFKPIIGTGMSMTSTANSFVGIYSGQWNSTSAITSMTVESLGNNLVAGSSIVVFATA